MPREILPRSAKRTAEQRTDNTARPETAADATKVDRHREERQVRKARLKAKQRGPNSAEECITVRPIEEQPRRSGRRAKRRDDNVAGPSINVVPEEHPRRPENQAEQLIDIAPFHSTTSVKMFDELPPPGENEPKTWMWHMRMLAYKRLTLRRSEYRDIDWESELDIQKFQRECVEETPCFVDWVFRESRKWPVPFACPKHSLGTNLMWRRRDEELREQWEARFAAEKEHNEAEWLDQDKRIERAFAEYPDLWLREALWEPVRPGVALITCTLLKAVATFFYECDITVEEGNLWNENRRYEKKGRDIVAQIQSGSREIEWSTRWRAQVNISIAEFRPPAHARDLEHPGHATVRNPKGRYGNALCALILYLGMTGEPAPANIDDANCSYWLYSAYGFSGPDFSKIGERGPFRMVRLSNTSHRDHNDFMTCFGLKKGKKRAKAFSDGFNGKVKRVQVTSLRSVDFSQWHNLPGNSGGSFEDDDPGEDDSEGEDPGEDDPFTDIGEEDSVHTVEDDLGGDDPAGDDPAEDDPAEDDPMEDAENEHTQDSSPEVSEMTDNGYQFDEEGDESDDGFQWPIPGMKNSIPRHLRGGAKK